MPQLIRNVIASRHVQVRGSLPWSRVARVSHLTPQRTERLTVLVVSRAEELCVVQYGSPTYVTHFYARSAATSLTLPHFVALTNFSLCRHHESPPTSKRLWMLSPVASERRQGRKRRRL